MFQFLNSWIAFLSYRRGPVFPSIFKMVLRWAIWYAFDMEQPCYHDPQQDTNNSEKICNDSLFLQGAKWKEYRYKDIWTSSFAVFAASSMGSLILKPPCAVIRMLIVWKRCPRLQPEDFHKIWQKIWRLDLTWFLLQTLLSLRSSFWTEVFWLEVLLVFYRIFSLSE